MTVAELARIVEQVGLDRVYAELQRRIDLGRRNLEADGEVHAD